MRFSLLFLLTLGSCDSSRLSPPFILSLVSFASISSSPSLQSLPKSYLGKEPTTLNGELARGRQRERERERERVRSLKWYHWYRSSFVSIYKQCHDPRLIPTNQTFKLLFNPTDRQKPLCHWMLLKVLYSLFYLLLSHREIKAISTYNMPKCPKFRRIFIVIIFRLESPGKLIPHRFEPCSFRMCLFLATMRHY